MTRHWDRVFAYSHVPTNVVINLLRVWCVRSKVKSLWLLDWSKRSSMQQIVVVRGLSPSEGVEYEKSYVPYTLKSLSWLHLPVEWTTFVSGLIQCTEYCDPLGLDCWDSLIIGFREAWISIQWQRESTKLFSQVLVSVIHHWWLRITWVKIRVTQ